MTKLAEWMVAAAISLFITWFVVPSPWQTPVVVFLIPACVIAFRLGDIRDVLERIESRPRAAPPMGDGTLPTFGRSFGLGA